MALSILNNMSALTAENNLSVTQASLQKTLTQLSSGSKITSGSDDAAGLAIANGLTANVAALTQSVQNATNGTGLLQTADGALSQVTTLLNRAVTLATEASNGGLTTNQSAAIQNEYSTILTQIGNIGTTTNFNGKAVFQNNNSDSFTSTQGSATSPLLTSTALTAGKTMTINDAKTGGTFVYTAQAGDTISTLQAAITAAGGAGGTLGNGTAATLAGGQLVIAGAAGDSLTVSSNDATLGNMAPTTTTNNSATVYLGDGTSTGGSSVNTTITNLTTTNLALGTVANALEGTGTAATELVAIDKAISTVASWRGTIGANVNDLTAATNVMNNQVQNLTSAESGISDADIGATVANMSKYTTLQQTGIAALQQANQASQSILKLLQ
jgi:flagellin